MEDIQILIGEHVIRICFLSSSVKTIYEEHMTFRSVKLNEQHDLLIHLMDGYGKPFTSYELQVNTNAASTTYRRSDYMIDLSADYSFAKIYVYDQLALKHALMHLYSSYIVKHNWGLLLHSSSVIDKNQAHMFCGHSGAGKSTAAKLSYPRTILADEATIVKITKQEAIVYHSPFRSEIKALEYEEPVKLSSIHLLIQAPYNEWSTLSKSEALLQLVDKVFYWGSSPSEMKMVFHLLINLLETSSVHHLFFEKNSTFWRLIS